MHNMTNCGLQGAPHGVPHVLLPGQEGAALRHPQRGVGAPADGVARGQAAEVAPGNDLRALQTHGENDNVSSLVYVLETRHDIHLSHWLNSESTG